MASGFHWKVNGWPLAADAERCRPVPFPLPRILLATPMLLACTSRSPIAPGRKLRIRKAHETQPSLITAHSPSRRPPESQRVALADPARLVAWKLVYKSGCGGDSVRLLLFICSVDYHPAILLHIFPLPLFSLLRCSSSAVLIF
jgi:hypothetical protein